MPAQVAALSLVFQPTPEAALAAVRVQAADDGTLWFCGADVATALGYVNAPDAIARHCRPDGIGKRDTVTFGRGEQEALFITEPNVYRLIVRSRRPEAVVFERWVMEDVLPAIRRTGRYGDGSGEHEAYGIRIKRAENQIAALAAHVETLTATVGALVARLQLPPRALRAGRAGRAHGLRRPLNWPGADGSAAAAPALATSTTV